MFKDLFNILTGKSLYFFIFEVDFGTKNKNVIDKKIIDYIKRYLFFRFTSINYFESYQNKVLISNAKTIKGKMDRNAFCFIIEAYAYFKDTKHQLKYDSQEKIIGDTKIKIYKLEKW